MTDQAEYTPITVDELSSKETQELSNDPPEIPKAENETLLAPVPTQETTRLKSVVRLSGGRNSRTLSTLKRVSFNDQIDIINVRSYKQYNKPEYHYKEKGCCGKNCLIF